MDYTLKSNPYKYKKCTSFHNVYTTVNDVETKNTNTMIVKGELMIKNDTTSYVFMTDCIKNDIYITTIVKEYSLKNYNSMKAIDEISKICNQYTL